MNSAQNTAQVSVAAKERLARLLASENLTVEHNPKFTTAAFDVKSRTLILPVWENMSPALYDLFVGHEIAHALWTPLVEEVKDWTKGFRAYVNVLEDVRIEKKVKRKFPGLVRPMINGYSDLVSREFFGEKAKWDSYSLIDRINLQSKLGSSVELPFTDAERAIYDRTLATESFDEVVALAREIYEAEKDRMEQSSDPDSGDEDGDSGEESDKGSDSKEKKPSKKKSKESDSGDEQDESEDSSDDASGSASGDDLDSGDGDSPSANADSESDSDGDSVDSDGEGDSPSDSSGNGKNSDQGENSDSNDSKGPKDKSGNGVGKAGSGGSTAPGEPTAITDDIFKEKEKELVSTAPYSKIVYKSVPKDEAFDLPNFVISPKFISSAVFANPAANLAKNELLADYTKFRSDNMKNVNFLVKEFEMRKAAAISARASIADTGVINTNKLHSYRWNENIFKKNTTLPQGKNHGLVLILDWSGSMSENIPGVIDQTLNLILFCKQVNIPFEVYAFSDVATPHVINSISRVSLPTSVHAEFDKLTATPHYTNKTFGYHSSKVSPSDMGVVDLINPYKVRLLNLVSSKSGKMDFLDSIRALMLIRRNAMACMSWVYGTPRTTQLPIPHFLNLGNTPLNESLILSIPVVNEFRKKNGVQIVSTIYMTDGQGSDVIRDAIKTGAWGDSTILRDHVSKKEWLVNYEISEYAQIANMFRERTGSKLVNFFLIGGDARNARYIVERLVPKEFHSKIGEVKKLLNENGGMILPASIAGYDKEFVLVPEEAKAEKQTLDASVAGQSDKKIMKQFRELKKNVGKGRLVLREFVSHISV